MDEKPNKQKIIKKKKANNLTFEPELSANTKKLTENLPKLENRLFFKK